MNIHRVLRKLVKHRPIFHSEADFQYAIALTIKEMYREDEVRLEYPIRLLSKEPEDNRALDIWIENKKIAIELKYPNKELNCSYDNESFALKRSRIHNSRYFFVADLERVENLVREHGVKKGFVIVITNNPSMWSRGRGASREFSLDDTLKGKITWHGTSPKKTDIILHGKYPMDWREYSKMGFRYMALEAAVI